MKKLVIWGCGGHGRVVLDVANAMNAYDDIVFYDEDRSLAGAEVAGTRVITGRIGDALAEGFAFFVIAIGSNLARAVRYGDCLTAGLNPGKCIHPTASVSASAAVGAGTVVMPRAVINAGATIGVNCIVNTGVIVEHDCAIGDHAHLSPSVTLGGGVTVGQYCHLGIGAIALPGSRIGHRSVIGAGGVVLKEVPSGVTFAGVPARLLKPHRD